MKHIALAAFAGLAFAACSPSEPVVENAPIASTPEQVAPSSDPTTPPTDPAASPPPTDSAALPPEDACNVAQYASLVGRPATDADVPAASPAVRHIRPDTQVTMDYRPDRLNIDINADGVITGFRCG